MPIVVKSVLVALLSTVRTRASLQLQILALRHQPGVLQGTERGRVPLRPADRLMRVALSRLWPEWRNVLVLVKPGTVIAQHPNGFRLYWRWKSRRGLIGGPGTPKEIRSLIREMSSNNVLQGAPRLHGELPKLGIEVSQATVAKYVVKHREPPSQTRRTFPENHVKLLASGALFVVPIVGFRVLYVFLVLAHERRRVVHLNVTEHPTAEWTAAQLMQAFPWNTAPRYLLRDRDRIYGDAFRTQAAGMAINEVLAAPRSPWQSPYVERLIGSIRRECLDHVVVVNESLLRRQIASCVSSYQRSRCHLPLEKDSADGRAIQPPELARAAAGPMVGGLFHRYER